MFSDRGVMVQPLISAQAYKSSSSSAALVAAPSDGPSGHWMFTEPSPL
eukprot:CAMPEP_0177194996 /NCGR_PEP_ID=MMETSP0367-20130122/23270_1 /TAXON_ID=447022 ORGANISM="Scrippsiella hangoei-like, Strain SHHI-4" /NCGR_SAMPLE_ID=MMETSP0367 /ASSEMBLY_ACC=CAM_ASM_000362 /LENGTH=47 /DNA_ID= /DNA_START= /DNA_END= /DNA_ORIENTATION=